MNMRRHQPAPPIDWSVDDADGPLQGPLALAFLRGRHLSLHLKAGQQALLLGEGRLQAVLGPGRHGMDIGDRFGDVDERWQLLFLCAPNGFSVRWTMDAPLRCGATGQWQLIGGCRLEVIDASAFHGTFLAGVQAVDPAFVLLLVGRLAQAAIAGRLLSPDPGAGTATEAALQARLTGLRAQDLAEELAPCGLACRELAVYTAAPPVDHEARRPDSAPAGSATHRAALPMSGHSDDLRRD